MEDFRVDEKLLSTVRSRRYTGIVTPADRGANPAPRVTDLLTILSTHRSGSTYMCDILARNALCYPAEYFYPRGGLVQLAEKWGCIREGVVDLARYGRRLRDEQSSQRGWLGLKVFADHLPYFDRSMPAFADLEKHWIHLVRRDQIAQAISMHVAKKSERWNSNYAPSSVEVTYDYSSMKNNLDMLLRDNEIIQAYIIKSRIHAITIYYEDLINDPVGQLRRVPGLAQQDLSEVSSQFSRQSTDRNVEWVRRFAADYLEEAFRREDSPREPVVRRGLAARARERLRSMMLNRAR